MSVHVHLLATRVDDGWRCSLHSALQVDRDALVSGAEPPAVCLTLDGPDGWVLTAVTCGSHVRTHAERDDPDELLSSLTAAGIDDPDGAIRDVLTGRSVTEAERDSPLGTLPRLAATLGWDGYFGDWRAALRQEEQRRSWRRADAVHPVEIVPTWLDREPEPIAGEHPRLAPIELHDVVCLGWFCNDSVTAALRITPPGPGLEISFPSPSAVRAVPRGRGFDIGLDRSPGSCSLLSRFQDLAAVLPPLPDGTELELFVADVDAAYGVEESWTSGDHRWRCVVRGGELEITHAYPPVDGGVLTEALALGRWVREGGTLRTGSLGETLGPATAVRWLVDDPDRDIRIGLRELSIDDAFARAEAARHIFLTRYTDTWDTRPMAETLAELDEIWAHLGTAPEPQ